MRLMVVTPMFFAFLAPLLGVASSFIGQAIVGVAVSVGLSYLARRQRPQPADTAPRGMSLSLQVDSNEPRQVAIGRCASAGSLKYHNTYGPNGNDYLQLVFILADHECDVLERVIVDGVSRTLGTYETTSWVSGQPVSGYDGRMWIAFHTGVWSQAADADLVARAPSGRLDANDRGRGVCYARVTIKADPERFKTGRPEIVFVFRGAKLYDPRKDTTVGGDGSHRWGDPSTYEWSDNAAVGLYNYLRGIYVNGDFLAGAGATADSLPVADWMAQMGICDEMVARLSGVTERRYRASGIIEVASVPRTVIREFLGACAGDLIDSGGVFKIRVGATQASVTTITDADLLRDADVEVSPKRSRADLVNTVYGSFTDPGQGFEMTALAPRVSPADQSADGGLELAEHYALPYVQSQTQGQRVTEILRRRGRYQQHISMSLRSRFCTLEAGDWITFNSDRYGISAGAYEVMQCQLGRDMSAAVELAEVAPSIAAWDPGADELNPGAPRDVEAGASTLVSVPDWDVQNVTVTSGVSGVSRPGIQATWTPIDDTTVTQINIEFRRQGDTVAMARTAIDPTAGEYTWVDGVQGGTVYEVRAIPVTMPRRATTWTGWAQTSSASSAQVVAVAAEALYIDPENIPPAELSEQSQFELSLVTAVDTVLGSVAQQANAARLQAEIAANGLLKNLIETRRNKVAIVTEQSTRISQTEALAQQITSVIAGLGDTQAAVIDEATARSNADHALAASVQTVSTSLAGNTAQVQVIQASLDGVLTRFAVTLTANGEVTGFIRLDGDGEATTFDVLADTFRVSQRGTAGGDPVAVFAIADVNGVPQLALRGDLIADGTIVARALSVLELSAIVANLGTIRAGRMLSDDGLFDINLDEKYISIST